MDQHSPDADASKRLVARVRAFSPAEWARVASSLAPYRGESIAALWRLAGLRSLWVSGIVNDVGPASHLLFAAGRLAAEFKPVPDPSTTIARFRESAATAPAAARPYREAATELLVLAQEALPGDLLAAEALLIAHHAAGYHATIPPADREKAFRPLAGVIAIGDILPPSPGAAV